MTNPIPGILTKLQGILDSKKVIGPNGKRIVLQEEAAVAIVLAIDATLEDGTKIFSDAKEWGVGVAVYTKGENDAPMPVPAGEYKLQDGKTISVGEDGKVADMKEAAADMSSEQIEQAFEQLATQLEAAQTELAAKITEVDTLKTELAAAATAKTSLQTDLAAIKAENVKLKAQPATGSVKDKNGQVVKQTAVVPINTANMTIHERMMLKRATA